MHASTIYVVAIVFAAAKKRMGKDETQDIASPTSDSVIEKGICYTAAVSEESETFSSAALEEEPAVVPEKRKEEQKTPVHHHHYYHHTDVDLRGT